MWQLLRTWTEIQRAETLDAEKAIAFSENLRRQSRWGEIDHHLLDMLKRELQEKYFVVTGNEDDHFWDREYSLKPGIRAEQVPEPLLRFACYVAVSYKVYGMDFQYLDTNYLFGLVEKVRPDMVKKLREHGTGRLPISLQKRKTEHFTASANDAFAVIRITARDNTEECCHEVLNYLCEVLSQEDFPRSYAVEFKGPEKSYLPITGLPKKGVNQLFACAVQYPGLHPLMERYARLAMRQYEQYTNLSDEQCALPGSFAVFALGMLGQEWRQLVWDYLDLCDDEHSHLQEKFLREYVKQFGFTADTVPVFVRGVLSMQNMKYSKDYAAWMANAESLDALLEAKIHLSEIVPSGFSSDEDDDDDEDEEPAEETEASPEEVLQYAWETVCYVIWGKASAKGGRESGGNRSGGTERALPTDFYSDNGEPGRKRWPAMSLPKRDGVQGRYYLIQKPDTNPEVLEHADQCIQDVLDGTAKENHSGYPVVVRNQSGTPFLPSQLLERYLSKLPLKGFPYEEAVIFCDALRRLVGWREIGHTLGKYIKHQVQERFFEIGENEDYFSPFPLCTVWPELRPEDVDENLLRFTCYVAVCYTVYGASDTTSPPSTS